LYDDAIERAGKLDDLMKKFGSSEAIETEALARRKQSEKLQERSVIAGNSEEALKQIISNLNYYVQTQMQLAAENQYRQSTIECSSDKNRTESLRAQAAANQSSLAKVLAFVNKGIEKAAPLVVGGGSTTL
jgi:hypothetical protein